MSHLGFHKGTAINHALSKDKPFKILFSHAFLPALPKSFLRQPLISY